MQLPPGTCPVSHRNVEDVYSITGFSHEILAPLIQNQTQTLLYAMVGNVVSGLVIDQVMLW